MTRRTSGKRVITIPGSVLVAMLTLSLIAAGVLIAAVASGPVLRTVTGTSSEQADSTPTVSQSPSGDESTSTASPKPSESTAETDRDDADGKSSTNKSKKKKKSSDKKASRELPVVVFNNTGQSGRAGTMADEVKGKGWKVTGVGNWSGQIPSTTVYYPDGKRKEAELLAEDLDVDRVQEAVEPMRSTQLTVIISGA